MRQFYDGYGEHFKYADGRSFCPDVKIKPSQECKPEPLKESAKCSVSRAKKDILSVFSDFDTDDIILLGVLAFLIFDGTDDYILLVILGIIFILGITDK